VADRDDFLSTVRRRLAERVNYLCSNPDCRRPTVGPGSDPNKSISIGVAAHITAAASGGKRYDPNFTAEERKSIDNGIWLCQNCAKLIDSDEEKYTVELLHTWKREAETQILQSIEGVADFSLAGTSVTIVAQANLLEQLAEFLSSETEKTLEQMRNEWREGKKGKVREWLINLKNDQNQWRLVDKGIKAKILRFEAGLELDIAGDIARAKELADEAFKLDSTEKSEARIRALIARREVGLIEAIKHLENQEDLNSQNMLAAFYLELGDKARCQDVLEGIKTSSEPNAETYRLKALLELANKDVRQARIEIRNAKENAPNWIVVQHNVAMIDYFSVLSPAVLPDHLIPWPEPVDRVMVKSDDNSLVRYVKLQKYSKN